jgi:hypothetical protein
VGAARTAAHLCSEPVTPNQGIAFGRLAG